jgi:hypothetical protein
VKYTETVLPTLGFVTDDKGTAAMSGIRVAALLRELERASPALLLKATDANKLAGAGEQRLGKQKLARHFLHGCQYEFYRPIRSQDPSAGGNPHAGR